MSFFLLDNLVSKYKKSHPRTRKAQINSLISLLVKGASAVITFLLVPLTINYLSKEVYGIWLTISSMISMLTLFDLGIGNSLRNKLSDAYTRQNKSLSKTFVSTAYGVYGLIQLIAVIIFVIASNFVSWQRLINTTISEKEITDVILITVVGISIRLVLDTLTHILLAVQESGLGGVIALVYNGLTVVGVYLLTFTSYNDLRYIAFVTSFCPVLVLAISGIFLYKNQLKDFKPSISYFNINQSKSLLTLGYNYFLIQISVLFLFYTDNIIINYFFGSSEVTKYNVVYKYFNLINTLFSLILYPYLPAFMEAYLKNEIEWMQQTYQKFKQLLILLIVIIVIMIGFSNSFFKMWLGTNLGISYSLTISLGIWVIVYSWNTITNVVINGLGKIKLQTYYAFFAAIINIPLSYYFGKVLAWGTTGVVAASICSLSIGSVVGGIQAKKLLSGTADGIWNK